MQKLDLSLDIPGAPIVRYAGPEPEWENVPALDAEASFAAPLRVVGLDVVVDAPRDEPALPKAPEHADAGPWQGRSAEDGLAEAQARRRPPHLRAVPSVRAAPVAAPEAVAGGSEVGARSREDFEQEEATTAPVRPEDAEVRQKVLEALRRVGATETSTVPAAATVAGDLTCKSIRVQGELRGSVTASGLVYLEDGAVLNGRIKEADMVIVAGAVSAAVNQVAVRCNGLVVLAESARVVGHIQCRAVAIYEGARVVGTVQSYPAVK